MTCTAPLAIGLVEPDSWLDMNARLFDVALQWQVAMWESSMALQTALMEHWQQLSSLPLGLQTLRGAEQLA